MSDAMQAVMVGEEPFELFWPDAQPLLQAHWAELSNDLDIPLAVDVDAYRAAEQQGHLTVLTARTDDGELVGYTAFLLRSNAHYKTSLQAVQDVFYVAPAWRGDGLGLTLIAEAERLLRKRGVQVVYHHVKVAHPALGYLLSHAGYARIEAIYAKRLDHGWEG